VSVRSCGSVNASTQDSHWIYEAAAGLGLCRLSRTSMGFSTCRFRAKTHRSWDLPRFEYLSLSLCRRYYAYAIYCVILMRFLMLMHFLLKNIIKPCSDLYYFQLNIAFCFDTCTVL